MKPSRIAIDGVFSAAQARACGMSGTALRQLVTAGEAHPLHRGWYSIWQPKGPDDTLRLRTRALLLEYGDVAVASHASAILTLGLPTEAIDYAVPHLMWRTPSQFFHAFGRFRGHELVDHPELPVQPVTVHPALACVQVGMHDQRSLIVAADAALRSELVTKRQLEAACEALAGQRGISQARAAVDWCDRRHESPGESLTAYVLRTLGYRFEPQFAPGTLGPGGGPEHVDFLIEGTRVIVEFDGKVKYTAKDEEEAQRKLFLEKRREDGIRELNYEVVRLTRADLEHPERVRAKIEAAILRSRVRSA